MINCNGFKWHNSWYIKAHLCTQPLMIPVYTLLRTTILLLSPFLIIFLKLCFSSVLLMNKHIITVSDMLLESAYIPIKMLAIILSDYYICPQSFIFWCDQPTIWLISWSHDWTHCGGWRQPITCMPLNQATLFSMQLIRDFNLTHPKHPLAVFDEHNVKIRKACMKIKYMTQMVCIDLFANKSFVPWISGKFIIKIRLSRCYMYINRAYYEKKKLE